MTWVEVSYLFLLRCNWVLLSWSYMELITRWHFVHWDGDDHSFQIKMLIQTKSMRVLIKYLLESRSIVETVTKPTELVFCWFVLPVEICCLTAEVRVRFMAMAKIEFVFCYRFSHWFVLWYCRFFDNIAQIIWKKCLLAEWRKNGTSRVGTWNREGTVL